MALALITVGAVASDSGPALKVSSLELEGEGHERQVELRPRPKHRLQSFASMNLLGSSLISPAQMYGQSWHLNGTTRLLKRYRHDSLARTACTLVVVMLSFGVDVEYRVQGDDSGITVFVTTQGEIFETVTEPVDSVSEETPDAVVDEEVQVKATEPVAKSTTVVANVTPKVQEAPAVATPVVAPVGKVKLSGIERRGEGRDSSIVLRLNGPAEPKVERIEVQRDSLSICRTLSVVSRPSWLAWILLM